MSLKNLLPDSPDNSRDSCGSGGALYITRLFQAGGESELQRRGARLGSLASVRFRRNHIWKKKKKRKSIFRGRISGRVHSIRVRSHAVRINPIKDTAAWKISYCSAKRHIRESFQTHAEQLLSHAGWLGDIFIEGWLLWIWLRVEVRWIPCPHF